MKNKSKKVKNRIDGISTMYKTFVRTENATTGITLIALVITIIVLLILAGITLWLTLGENGIIKKAIEAKRIQTEAEQKEKKDLADLYSSMLIATNGDSQITISMEDLTTLIDTKVDQKIKTMNVGTVPAGTVISYMGNNVPGGYLSCNGATYNISDYPNLAEQIKNEFGSYNYYGGDGTTTFAVPDLRGEFLRGTGTNSHANQGSGIAVGKHQDSTRFPNYLFGANRTISFYGKSSYHQIRNVDNIYKEGDMYAAHIGGATDHTSTTTVTGNIVTIRPTNTSVLYCIKY